MQKIENKILENNLKQITKICLEYNISQLWAFGSVVSDRFNEQSDIDLLVNFKPMDFEDYADNYFIVCEIFENLFKRKIDLVTINSLSNPYFINSINKNKILLYE